MLLALAMVRVRANDFATAAHLVDAIQQSPVARPEIKAWAKALEARVPELVAAKAAQK